MGVGVGQLATRFDPVSGPEIGETVPGSSPIDFSTPA